MSLVNLAQCAAVTVITVDNPPVNALSHGVRDGLMRAVAEADEDEDCKAIVINCAGRTFIAGADIKEFGKAPVEPYLADVIGRIEACNKPVVAAIHGTALGGGFEVALACHYRIALETAAVGLPEVNLGLLPGASGTQRLPRLIGAAPAMDIMLSGKPVDANSALKLGAVDQVASDDLLVGAIAFAKECAKECAIVGPRRISDMEVPDVDPGLFDVVRKKIASKTRGLLSPERIIRCVELATTTDFSEGLVKEREYFLECMASPQSAGLRHAFFAERQVSKPPGIDKNTVSRNIGHVAVIGAGTMGAGIAYACLTSGLNVTLLDNDNDGLARGVRTVESLYAGGVKRKKVAEDEMTKGLNRFTSSQRYKDIADVDIVIEAVFENMAIKKEVFGALDKVLKPSAILATNTSTLSIDEIAAATGRPGDVIGLHFFSPAHIMRLLEIVRGTQTADDVIVSSLLLAKKLRKVGVVVGNCFGFVGNRMLYSYGREVQMMLLEGAAPEYIDQTLVNWGMAMGPNAVGDLAGLDVGYKARLERPKPVDDPCFYRVTDMLVNQGRYGQKTGKGMYRYAEGSRTPAPDPEVASMIRAEAERLKVPQREITEDEIVERCIYALIVEGSRILEEGIANRSADIDVVWMNGYGFPKHRGGPMHYADAVGLSRIYETVCEFREQFGSMYWEPPALLKDLANSGGRFADVGN
jgi:3-hydroxyacyl-CoA dehydrogenase